MARKTTPILNYQSTASVLTDLMLLRSCAVHVPSGLQSVIKKYLSCLGFNASGYQLLPLNMLTDMPYRFIGFTKCGSRANTYGVSQ